MTILEDRFKELRGKTAWITGGRRIGQTIAKALAEQGVNIVTSYKSSREEAETIVREAEAHGVKALAVQADVSSRDSLAAAVKTVIQQFPKIHYVINLASVFKPVAFDKITEQDWDLNIKVHILGSFWVAQQLAPHMPSGSHIINIADRTSIGRKYKNYLPYVVTKAAVAELSKTLAVELADRGIFVHTIAPGPILRPPEFPEAEWKELRASSPLKYPIDDEIAVTQFATEVLRLCTDTMTSGDIVPLDQGQNL